MLEQVDSQKLEPASSNGRSFRSPVYSDPFLSNCLLRSRPNYTTSQRGSGEMSFKNDFTKLPAEYLANSCPSGLGLNIMPSVGRFKDSDLVPTIYMTGNVQAPAYNAFHSMASQTNYGMLKDQQIRQHIEQRPTHSGSSGTNLGPEGKVLSCFYSLRHVCQCTVM